MGTYLTVVTIDNRLVEKFAVLGRDDIAEPLSRLLPILLSDDANVEILTLLLALSDRPAETVEFDESKFIVETIEEKELTWTDILAEEPFVGDHWKEPDYDGSDDDEDWVYQTRPAKCQSDPIDEAEEKVSVQIQPDEEKSIIDDSFLQRQYWLRQNDEVLPQDHALEPTVAGTLLLFHIK